MHTFLKFFFCAIVLTTSAVSEDWLSQGFFEIEKKGVLYRFCKADVANAHFAMHDFPKWENETFEVFDQVKDPEGIAIDIGAWIGTTAIWLAKNFHHVIAIEADKESLHSIAWNLKASECHNVTLCPFAIADTHEDVLFGPRGPRLNDSMSCIKAAPSNLLDYSVKSFPLKQILFDYVYSNAAINAKRIAFIKCDIEGGEEAILEDLLHFAYYNNVPLYLSFHLEWWKSKRIEDFEELFRYFKTNCPWEDLCHYIRCNPFCSLLFKPKEGAGTLIKKNMTAVIIGYNQPSYIKNMVNQLQKFTSDIVVVDNNSDAPSLLSYYEKEYKYTLLRQPCNFGYTVYQRDAIQKLVGDVYILTDPDLQFNPNLPENFIENLLAISNYFQSGRVGFALLIDADDIRSDITYRGYSIKDWESAFWKNKLSYPLAPHLQLFEAPIDTTFCLINKKFQNSSIRMAGDFTCKHLPWHTNFRDFLEEGEYENYLRNNISTNWFSIIAWTRR